MAGSKITTRLEIATQTTGAAQTERELAKVGQSAAAAGVAAEKGMERMGAASAKAGGQVDKSTDAMTESLDSLGKKFEVTDKASELLGKLGTAFGLVGAAAALLTPVVDVVSQALKGSASIARQAASEMEAITKSTEMLSSALGELSLVADERTVESLLAIGRASVTAAQDIERSRGKILALRLAQEQGIGADYLVSLGLTNDGESAEDAIVRNTRRLDTAKAFWTRATATYKRVSETAKKELEASSASVTSVARSARRAPTLLDQLSAPLTPSLADTIGIGQNTTDTLSRELDEAYSVEERYQQAIWKLRSDYQTRASQLREQALAQTQAASIAQAEAIGSEAGAFASVALAAFQAGESITKALAQQAAAKSMMALADAVAYGASALGALAFGQPEAAASFAAAAAQSVAAAAAYGALGALGGGFSGGGGGGGASSAPVSSESLTGPRESSGGGGDIVINANFQGQPLLTDRAVAEAIGRGVSEANRQRGNPIYGRLS